MMIVGVIPQRPLKIQDEHALCRKLWIAITHHRNKTRIVKNKRNAIDVLFIKKRVSRMRDKCKYHVFSVVRSLFLFIAVFVGCMVLDECDGLSSNTSRQQRPDAGAITHRASAIFALMESMKKKNVFAIRVLEQDPAYLDLDQRDRAFARLLLSTAERRSGQIEAVIRSFERKEKKKNSKVRIPKTGPRLCL